MCWADMQSQTPKLVEIDLPFEASSMLVGNDQASLFVGGRFSALLYAVSREMEHQRQPVELLGVTWTYQLMRATKQSKS